MFSNTNHPVRFLPIPVLLFIIGAVILAAAGISADDTTPTTVSNLDLSQSKIAATLTTDDWPALRMMLAEIDAERSTSAACDMEPVMRFLTGHAALATGANSEAVSHFYCPCDSTGSESLKAWMAWTGRLINDHKESLSASMHYLRGDALARNNEMNEAIREFDAALALDAAHVLALNARGVVKWLLFEQDSSLIEYELGAVNDLMAASKADTNFADAWANRGMVGLRDFSALGRAGEMFEKAVTLDSTYWLALNGKAVCAGAAGEYWEFGKAIGHLMDKAPNTPYVQINAAPSGDKRVSPGARGASTALSYAGKAMERAGVDPVKWGGVGIGDAWGKVNQQLNSPQMAAIEKNMGSIGKLALNIARGGIFMFIKKGDNLYVNEDGSQELAGTWFTLNYPLTAIEQEKEE